MSCNLLCVPSAQHRPTSHACRPRRACRSIRAIRSRAPLQINAIGFDFGDREKSETYSGFASARQPKRQSPLKSAGYLASQLLVYHSVVKGAIGEAFLAMVACLFKATASNKDIVDAYSSLYYKLAVSGYDTWEDYVLDQILFARDNTFARAVAEGLLKGDAPLRAAAAHDLDILQQLAVPQQQLLQYLSSVVPSTSESYVEAGESTSPKSHEHRALLAPSSSSTPYAFDISGTHRYLQGPLSAEQLAHWKSAVASKERWSDALPLVQHYYHRHGYGLTSRNATLREGAGAAAGGHPGGGDGGPGGGCQGVRALPPGALHPHGRPRGAAAGERCGHRPDERSGAGGGHGLALQRAPLHGRLPHLRALLLRPPHLPVRHRGGVQRAAAGPVDRSCPAAGRELPASGGDRRGGGV